MRRVVLPIAFLALLATSSAGEDSPDWWNVDRDVVDALHHRDLDDWVAELEAAPFETDAAALLIRVLVLSRAGHEESAGDAAEALARLPGEDQPRYMQPRCLAFERLVRAGQLAPALRLLKVAPWFHSRSVVTLLGMWADEVGDAEPDGWLRDRVLESHRIWFEPRVQFHRMRGTTDALLDELEAEARSRPGETSPALDFARASTRDRGTDLAWLVELARPATAWDCYALGAAISNLDPPTALTLLDRSMELPFDKASERGFLDATVDSQAPPGTGKAAEAGFRSWTRHELLGVLRRLDRKDRVLALLAEMPEAVDGANPGLAGRAGEAEGGGPPGEVGRAILDREPADSDDWLGRALYFEARGDIAEAKRSLFAALSVAPPTPPRGKGARPRARSGVLDTIVDFLKRTEGEGVAAAFVYEQLQKEEPGSDIAERLVDELRMMRNSKISIPDPFDPRLWSYLEARKVWSSTEQILIGNLAGRAGAEGRHEVHARAELLTVDAHPSRGIQLAASINPRDAGERALVVRLMEKAIPRISDPGERCSATRLFFDHLVRFGRWQDAARLLSEVRPDSRTLTTLAAKAARAGDRGAALSLWLRRTNLDRADPVGVRDLAREMGPTIRAWYAALRRRDPAFVTPHSLAEALGEGD